MKIVIIGSGFGGLATAALLGKYGHDVVVIEKNKEIGGRARVYKDKGFTFDMGPSWYLMPEVFEKFFAHFDHKISDLYKIQRLDPSYRIFWNKDEITDISADLEKNIKLFDNLEENGGSKLLKYLDKSKLLYDLSVKYFLYKSYDRISDLFNKTFLREGRKLNLLEMIKSFESYTSKHFKSDRAKKILEYSIVFLGGSPANTPALYSLLSHVDFNLGVYYPVGGFGKVIDAIEKIALANNVKIITNEEVKSIKIENAKAKSVVTSSNEYPADIVVANADYAHVETKLLEPKYRSYDENYWAKKTIAPSAFILYLGINKRLKNLEHHNLFLHHDWMKHFSSIFNSPDWPTEPSYYVCCPSKTDTSVAPAGSENIFVLVPIASGIEDTDEIRESFYQNIITHLEELTGESIKDSIVSKRIFAIKDFASDYNSYKGSALGLSNTLMQTAIMRPKNQSSKVKNLFFVGQYTHPGIGVPTSIISAEVVSDKIQKFFT